MIRPKILVITPISHIRGLQEILESFGDVTYLTDPSYEEVYSLIASFDAIYTNPNKSKVYIDQNLMRAAKNLKVICTASTGTNHIDKFSASEFKIKIISLTEERQVIDKISSTAELAFALTLNSLRHITSANSSVLRGEWDYTPYVGRQLNYLTIGIIGFGRLGKLYAKYADAFGAQILVYDPYKTDMPIGIKKIDSLNELLSLSDVISLHVHVTDETIDMLNEFNMQHLKSDVIIVNTSRGDVINEEHLVDFLKKNPKSKFATDVIANEIRGRSVSPILSYAISCQDQILITPHIGGMTQEAQEIAYSHAAKLLKDYLIHI